MLGAVAGAVSREGVTIEGGALEGFPECVSISFPGFPSMTWLHS